MTQHDAPVIIEAALNRVTNRERNANVPATAEEQAKDDRVRRGGRDDRPHARAEHRGPSGRGR